MDQILFPYIESIETNLIKKKKLDNKAHLLLSDSIFIVSNDQYKDEGYLDDYKIEEVYEDNNDLYHVVAPEANSKSYTMRIDMDNRINNMSYYLAEKIIALIFRRLYATSLKDSQSNLLEFENKNLLGIEKIIKSVEALANKVVRAGIDTKISKEKDKYYVNIPSLGTAQISYPVLANSSELVEIIFTDLIISKDKIQIEYECGSKLIDDYRTLRKDKAERRQLIKDYGIDLSVNEIIKENIYLKDQVKSLKTQVFLDYIEKIDDIYEVEDIRIVNHIISELEIQELSFFISLVESDIAIISNEGENYSNLIISNNTGFDINSLIKKISEIYPIELYKDETYLRARIENQYLRRFLDTLNKDLINQIKETKKNG